MKTSKSSCKHFQCDCCIEKQDKYTELCQSILVRPNLKVQRCLRANFLDVNISKTPRSQLEPLSQCLKHVRDLYKIKITGITSSERLPITTSIMRGLSEYMNVPVSLRRLELSSIWMSSDGWKYLQLGLSNRPSIKTLKITGCNMRDEDLCVLLPGLLSCKNLVCFDLSRNLLEYRAGHYIGRLITRQDEVTSELEWAAGLRGETSNAFPFHLSEIILKRNKLKPSAINDLCSALMYDSHILSLCLRNNPLSEESFHSLNSLLITNRALIKLDLKNTGLENRNEICDKISRNIKESRVDSKILHKCKKGFKNLFMNFSTSLSKKTKKDKVASKTVREPRRTMNPFAYKTEEAGEKKKKIKLKIKLPM